MCGLAGIIGASLPREELEPRLKRMTDVLRHRGPDDEGMDVRDGIALGHRRLSIIDTSRAGRQPLGNEDGSVRITYNGEIYNYRELKASLMAQGHVFRSNTDTEVIVHLYEQYGESCLSRLKGMFAFAIYDDSKRRLFAARDRIGIKPFFYFHNGHTFVFASEIKAILESGMVERALDYEAFYHYLSLNYMPLPMTMFKDIVQLAPAHYLIYENGAVFIRRYWQCPRPASVRRPFRQMCDELDAVLADVVRDHLISDVPLGAFLSGGVDSSVIVSYMQQSMSEPPRTFSIGFREKSFNEIDHARRVARHVGAIHRDATVTPRLIDLIHRLVWHAEEPTADASMLPLYCLAQIAREHVTVALAGDGADELFAGYSTYQADMLAPVYCALPSCLRNGIIEPLIRRLPVSGTKDSLQDRLMRFIDGSRLGPDKCHLQWRTIFSENEKQHLLTRDACPRTFDTPSFLFRRYPLDAPGKINRALLYDTEHYLPCDMLVKVDRMSMANSLEVRVPFLDHRVVEYAFSIDQRYKLRALLFTKHILKKVAARTLPRENVYRKKAGFSIPVDEWFRGELKTFSRDILTRQTVERIGMFNYQYICTILDRHERRQQNNGYKIWCLIILALWFERFMRQP